MKKLSAILVAGGLAAGAAVAQYPNGMWTRPVAPAKDALDRLNLAQAWFTRIATDGPKDGIESVQHLGSQIIVQSRRGDIVSLDPKTGATQWRALSPTPYHVTHEVGYNNEVILVTGSTRVVGLDRASGEMVWITDLPSTPSSPPTADADGFYICLSNGRLAAYSFPLDLGQPVVAKQRATTTEISRGKAPPPPAALNDRNYAGLGFNNARSAVGSNAIYDRRSAQVNLGEIGKRPPVSQVDIKNNMRGQLVVNGPKLRWEYSTHRRIQDRPILSSQSVLVVSTDQYAIVVDRKRGEKGVELPANGAISAPVGHYGEIAYVTDRDGTVYCYDLHAKALRWTYSTNSTSTIRTEPRATDEDLYINADFGGLIRLDRSNGVPHWQAADAFRYLASNRKFVYASDKHHHLLVLDRVKGSILANYDASAFPIAVANDATDRLILAAQDGSILCLHDRGYSQPLSLRAAEPKIAQSVEAKTVKEPKPEKKLEPPPSEKVEPKAKAEPKVEPKAKAEPKPATPATPPKAKDKV